MSFLLDHAETIALQRHLLSLGAKLGSYGPKKDGVDGEGGNTTRGEFHRLFGHYFPSPTIPALIKKQSHDFPADKPDAMMAYFGQPGENQTMVVCPYPMRLSWDLGTPIHRFSCHEKVATSLNWILTKTLEHYGIEQIRDLGLDRFGGCLNVRMKRGGTTWSTHAWGAAVDLWPEVNQLSWDGTRAQFAKPEYEPFFQIVEAAGWTSLGRARDFDWMHIQAPHL